MQKNIQTVIHCNKTSDIPYGDHYAIIKFVTILDSYDSNQVVQQYVAYTDKAEWEQAISDLTLQRYSGEFVPIKVTRAIVKTTVEVK